MLIVIGAARPLPGHRAELVAAAQRMVAATEHDEGCESYGFFVDVNDSERFVNLEIWRDQRALDDHMGHGHTREFLESTAELFDGEPAMTVHYVAPSSALAEEAE